jgi:hypothetical protein
MIGKGNPFQNKLKGAIDDLYLDTNGPVLWVKEADAGKVTGWKCIGIVVPTDDSTNWCAPIRPRLEGHPH